MTTKNTVLYLLVFSLMSCVEKYLPQSGIQFYLNNHANQLDTAFYFWDILRQQNVNLSNLYAQQPFQIEGNIKNINNEEEVVLGYFTVAGATNKRIFLDRPSLPFEYSICEPDYNSMRFIKYKPPSTWPIYLTQDRNTCALGMGTLESCFDCRLDGGELTPPDFWVN